MYDVIVIGGGASGMSAALYCKRAGMSVLIIERELFGGQINNTSTIENYIGVGNITGEALSEEMYKQIQYNNIETTYGNVKRIVEDDESIFVNTGKKSFEAKSVILATGVKHKELGVTGEIENQGEGVSYCAICDGFAFKDKNVIVIGGGDSAFEEGIFLSDIAKDVTILYYKDKDKLKAKRELYEKFVDKENTNILYNTNVNLIVKNSKDVMELYCNTSGKTGMPKLDMTMHDADKDVYGVRADGVFIYVGVEPVNEIAKESLIKLDKNGYVIVNDKYMTNLKNVFAIGDLIHTDMKQVSIAVADGALVSKYVKEAIQ